MSDDIFLFDDFKFARSANIFNLDLAYRARHGDEIAIQLLKAGDVEIIDANGAMYWPMAAKVEAPVKLIPQPRAEDRELPHWKHYASIPATLEHIKLEEIKAGDTVYYFTRYQTRDRSINIEGLNGAFQVTHLLGPNKVALVGKQGPERVVDIVDVYFLRLVELR